MITDNFMIAFEMYHYLNRKTQGRDDGFSTLKLDMSKSCDRVIEWDFFKTILLRMGFGEWWVNIIF